VAAHARKNQESAEYHRDGIDGMGQKEDEFLDKRDLDKKEGEADRREIGHHPPAVVFPRGDFAALDKSQRQKDQDDADQQCLDQCQSQYRIAELQQ